MNLHNWHSRLLSVLYFPDSEYLAAKWWHRLALVILWMWLIYATGSAIHNLWDILEGFEYARMYGTEEGFSFNPYFRARENSFFCVLWLLSVFVPIVVYRVILFVGVGDAWKGEPAR